MLATTPPEQPWMGRPDAVVNNDGAVEPELGVAGFVEVVAGLVTGRDCWFGRGDGPLALPHAASASVSITIAMVGPAHIRRWRGLMILFRAEGYRERGFIPEARARQHRAASRRQTGRSGRSADAHRQAGLRDAVGIKHGRSTNSRVDRLKIRYA
jgi:hypothetical protein